MCALTKLKQITLILFRLDSLEAQLEIGNRCIGFTEGIFSREWNKAAKKAEGRKRKHGNIFLELLVTKKVETWIGAWTLESLAYRWKLMIHFPPFFDNKSIITIIIKTISHV